MPLSTRIRDSITGLSAEVFSDSKNSGLVVFTEPLNGRETSGSPFFNPNQGIDMNVDASFTGTPDGVHNGTDTALWTATVLSGAKFDLASTNQAHAGTKSIESANANTGDFIEIQRASTIDLSGYVAVSMFIYVASNWDPNSLDSIEFFGWDTATGLRIGTGIRLESYFNETVTGSWQSVVIPLGDLDLSGITMDAFGIEIIQKSGQGPTFYIDDIQVEQTGGTVEYSVSPSVGKKLYVTSLRFFMVDDITVLTYNKWMGLTKLTNGVGISLQSFGEVTQSFNMTDLADLVFIGADIVTKEVDATNTMVSFVLEFKQPIVLNYKTLDTAKLSINDDLSGLLMFRALLSGYERDV